MNDVIYGALAIPYKIDSSETKFLLLKHVKGYWTFPGGGMDEGDNTLEETLTRELKEEIGLNVNKEALINTGLINHFVYDNVKPERAGKKGETHFYLLKLTGSENLGSWDKIVDHGWFTRQEIINLLPYKDEREIFSKAVTNS